MDYRQLAQWGLFALAYACIIGWRAAGGDKWAAGTAQVIETYIRFSEL